MDIRFQEAILFAENFVSHVMNRLFYLETPYRDVDVFPRSEEYRRNSVHNGFSDNVRKAVDFLLDLLSCSIESSFNEIVENGDLSRKSLEDYAKRWWECYLSQGVEVDTFLRFCVMMAALGYHFYRNGLTSAPDVVTNIIVFRVPIMGPRGYTCSEIQVLVDRFVKENSSQRSPRVTSMVDTEPIPSTSAETSSGGASTSCVCFQNEIVGTTFEEIYDRRNRTLDNHSLNCYGPRFMKSLTPLAFQEIQGSGRKVTESAESQQKPDSKSTKFQRSRSEIFQWIPEPHTADMSRQSGPPSTDSIRDESYAENGEQLSDIPLSSQPISEYLLPGCDILLDSNECSQDRYLSWLNEVKRFLANYKSSLHVDACSNEPPTTHSDLQFPDMTDFLNSPLLHDRPPATSSEWNFPQLPSTSNASSSQNTSGFPTDLLAATHMQSILSKKEKPLNLGDYLSDIVEKRAEDAGDSSSRQAPSRNPSLPSRSDQLDDFPLGRRSEVLSSVNVEQDTGSSSALHPFLPSYSQSSIVTEECSEECLDSLEWSSYVEDESLSSDHSEDFSELQQSKSSSDGEPSPDLGN